MTAIEVGSRHGKLEVLEYVGADGEGKALIRVRCDCGTRLTMEARQLLGSDGRVAARKDCGRHGESRAARDERLTTRHGGKPRRTLWGLHRPGVEAGGHPKEPGWPVSYIVVAGGVRTEHDDFGEAAAEFRLRRGMA